jgi:hypothetical protein
MASAAPGTHQRASLVTVAPCSDCTPLGAGVFIGVPPTGGSIASTEPPGALHPSAAFVRLGGKEKPAGCTGRAESSGARITRGDMAPGRLKPNSSAAAPRLQCLSLQRSIVGWAGWRSKERPAASAGGLVVGRATKKARKGGRPVV